MRKRAPNTFSNLLSADRRICDRNPSIDHVCRTITQSNPSDPRKEKIAELPICRSPFSFLLRNRGDLDRALLQMDLTQAGSGKWKNKFSIRRYMTTPDEGSGTSKKKENAKGQEGVPAQKADAYLEDILSTENTDANRPKSTSQRKIEANRRNASRSTGPRTKRERELFLRMLSVMESLWARLLIASMRKKISRNLSWIWF